MLNLGYKISGSDLKRSAVTDRLKSLGAIIFEAHASENIEAAEVVVTSSAISAGNPEVVEAQHLHIPVIPRAEMLAELMRLKYGIAIAGMHGKTTTTSMVAAVLAAGGLDPTVVVGGRVDSMNSNARLGRSQYLVAEADESDRSFLKLSPILAVVTNIDREHMDCYRSMQDVKRAFLDFMDRVPFYGMIVACNDDAILRRLFPKTRRRMVTYGIRKGSDFLIKTCSHGPPDPLNPDGERASSGVAEFSRNGKGTAFSRAENGRNSDAALAAEESTQAGTPLPPLTESGSAGHPFDGLRASSRPAEAAFPGARAGTPVPSLIVNSFKIKFRDKELGEFRLSVPGMHNVLNATAAIAVGIGLDIPIDRIREALENFRGVDRRFQVRGQAGGVTVIDDYGHHPTEIRATLAAARQCGYRKIHVIFQPHRYTRTRDLIDEFATAFGDADSLIVLDIYAASEQPIEGITGEVLARKIAENGFSGASYADSFDHAVEATISEAAPGDMILTLGAGSVSQLGPMVLEKLQTVSSAVQM
jgi:UDP-N-acetylmuramate-alanine ligase